MPGTGCGIHVAAVRATVNQALPDLTEQALLHGAPMAPSYAWILTSDNGTIIHDIPFTWDGPVFSAGTAWDDWAKSVVAK